LIPLIIPLFVMNDGTNWRYSFFITFGLSIMWIILWWTMYKRPEKHNKVSEEELNYIFSDSNKESPKKISWKKVLVVKETWAFAAAKLTDAVWWFYLFWGGMFLNAEFGLKLKGLA